MKKKLPLQSISLFFILCGIVSCATPIAPTGGPADKTAPDIVYTKPESGTTNFRGNSFEFQFNEYINRSSVASAITVEPDLGIPFDVSWKRKRMFVNFQNELPDSTTIIIKLGGNIADTKGNRMDKTTTIAVSTGDDIDGGEISGRVLLTENGRGAAQRRILLYREPIDFNSKANYEVQTDTSGSFQFSYLREGRYQAILVDDRNRNKKWERPSELAQPFYQKFIELEKNGNDTLDVLYTSTVDTLQPRLLGLGLQSTNRLRLRFSEDIIVSDDIELHIADSTGNRFTTAYPLYINPKENFVLFAQSEEALQEQTDYFLQIAGITDFAGNSVDTAGVSFTGSAQEDSTLQRIISVNGARGLTQQEPLIVTYATPITEPELTDSVVVIEGTIDFDDWPEIEVVRNQLHIKPQENWIEDTDYQFLVWNPVTQRRKMYEPETWDSTNYGDIEITLDSDSLNADYMARLLDPDGNVKESLTLRDTLLITDLPPLSYSLIVFEDKNENKKWDSGTVIPFEAPEPYFVQRGIRVQEGFTSQIDINFN